MAGHESAGLPRRLRAVFLDRDGVLNVERFDYVTSPAAFELLPGAVESVRRLNQAGVLAVVVTNQAGISRGLYTAGDLALIHRGLHAALAAQGAWLDGLYYCPELDGSAPCRKPRPGMLQRAARELGFHTTEAVLVGDTLRDIEAARRCGAGAILVRTGKGTRDEPLLADGWFTVDAVLDDLPAAVDWILARCAS